jgi:hypothetical protein
MMTLPPSITFGELLDALGYQPTQHISICRKTLNSPGMRSEITSVADAPRIPRLDKATDWYFGLNILAAVLTPNADGTPRRGRGGDADIIRLMALHADIDVGDGKCTSYEQARAIVDHLASRIETRPTATLYTGHGIQPLWPIGDGPTDPATIAATLARWQALVTEVAAEFGVELDDVSNPSRISRIPGGYNVKDIRNERVGTRQGKRNAKPIRVRCERDSGTPVTMAQLDAELPESAPGIDPHRADRWHRCRPTARHPRAHRRRRVREGAGDHDTGEQSGELDGQADS